MPQENKFIEYKVDTFEEYILLNFKEKLMENQVQK